MHEWRVWETLPLPEGKIIIPGLLGHANNYVEHPELIAEYIVRYADLVGRERVIAGADCGAYHAGTDCRAYHAGTGCRAYHAGTGCRARHAAGTNCGAYLAGTVYHIFLAVADCRARHAAGTKMVYEPSHPARSLRSGGRSCR
jgi:hypothetical protein